MPLVQVLESEAGLEGCTPTFSSGRLCCSDMLSIGLDRVGTVLKASSDRRLTAFPRVHGFILTGSPSSKNEIFCVLIKVFLLLLPDQSQFLFLQF